MKKHISFEAHRVLESDRLSFRDSVIRRILGTYTKRTWSRTSPKETTLLSIRSRMLHAHSRLSYLEKDMLGSPASQISDCVSRTIARGGAM